LRLVFFYQLIYYTTFVIDSQLSTLNSPWVGNAGDVAGATAPTYGELFCCDSLADYEGHYRTGHHQAANDVEYRGSDAARVRE